MQREKEPDRAMRRLHEAVTAAVNFINPAKINSEWKTAARPNGVTRLPHRLEFCNRYSFQTHVTNPPCAPLLA